MRAPSCVLIPVCVCVCVTGSGFYWARPVPVRASPVFTHNKSENVKRVHSRFSLKISHTTRVSRESNDGGGGGFLNAMNSTLSRHSRETLGIFSSYPTTEQKVMTANTHFRSTFFSFHLRLSFEIVLECSSAATTFSHSIRLFAKPFNALFDGNPSENDTWKSFLVFSWISHESHTCPRFASTSIKCFLCCAISFSYP